MITLEKIGINFLSSGKVAKSCAVIYNRLRATRDESVRKNKEDREMQERDDREYREWAWDDKLKRGLQELDEKEAAEDAAHAKEYPDFVSAAVVEDGGECDDIANDNNAISAKAKGKQKASSNSNKKSTKKNKSDAIIDDDNKENNNVHPNKKKKPGRNKSGAGGKSRRETSIDDIEDGMDEEDMLGAEEGGTDTTVTVTATARKANQQRKKPAPRKKAPFKTVAAVTTTMTIEDLGSMPTRPVLEERLAEPTKKDLNHETVSTKVSSKKYKDQIDIANGRIQGLFNHVNQLRPKYNQLHDQTQQSIDTGWNYMGDQNEVIKSQRKELSELKEAIVELEKSKIVADGKIESLEKDIKHSKENAKRDANDIKLHKAQMKELKKKSREYTMDEEMEMDQQKTNNQIRLAQEREFAKLDAKEEGEDRKKDRTSARFQSSKDSFERSRSGKWDIRCRGRRSRSRSRSYDRRRSRSRSSDRHGSDRRGSGRSSRDRRGSGMSSRDRRGSGRSSRSRSRDRRGSGSGRSSRDRGRSSRSHSRDRRDKETRDCTLTDNSTSVFVQPLNITLQ